jgi:hypothetical protein
MSRIELVEADIYVTPNSVIHHCQQFALVLR